MQVRHVSYADVAAVHHIGVADLHAPVVIAGGEHAGLIAEIEQAIADRMAAKKAKNYAEADRIRNELAARGVILTDTKEGTTYTIK